MLNKMLKVGSTKFDESSVEAYNKHYLYRWRNNERKGFRLDIGVDSV